MNKTGLELILFLLLIVSLILLGIIINDPEEFLKLIEKIDYSNYDFDGRNVRRKFQMGTDNMVLMYKTVINGLTFFSCTCLICLSYLVSKK